MLIFVCWDTRTRTKNDRTRICSVTITPYPNINFAIKQTTSLSFRLIADAKLQRIFVTAKKIAKKIKKNFLNYWCALNGRRANS